MLHTYCEHVAKSTVSAAVRSRGDQSETRLWPTAVTQSERKGFSLSASLSLNRSVVFRSAFVCAFSSAPAVDLSEPVDVYSDWIDACEAANQ